MTDERRYTFLWWGDGYAVFDGDDYIGKDDQVDLLEMLVESGLAVQLNMDEAVDVDDWDDSLAVTVERFGLDVR